jgi:hypothetical protein
MTHRTLQALLYDASPWDSAWIVLAWGLVALCAILAVVPPLKRALGTAVTEMMRVE